MPAAEGEVVSELPSGAQPRRMRGTAAAALAAADLVGCAGGASPRRGGESRGWAVGATTEALTTDKARAGGRRDGWMGRRAGRVYFCTGPCIHVWAWKAGPRLGSWGEKEKVLFIFLDFEIP